MNAHKRVTTQHRKQKSVFKKDLKTAGKGARLMCNGKTFHCFGAAAANCSYLQYIKP